MSQPPDEQSPSHGGSLFQQMYYAQQQQRMQAGYGSGGYTPPPLQQVASQQQQQQQQQQGMYGAQAPPTAAAYLPRGPSGVYGGAVPPPPPPHPQSLSPYAAYTAMPPPPPPPVMYTQAPSSSSLSPVGGNEDYYKGFHDGVVRPAGPVWGSAVSWIAPLVVNVAFFVLPIWYVRRKYMQAMSSAAASAAAAAGGAAGGAAAAGKKPSAASNPASWLSDMMNPMKAKVYRTEVKGTTFKDVIGIPEAKDDLKQYVDFLKDPGKFTRLGARLPKGCLLTGSPGTGKTLIARAVAGEASTPFLTCSGADFIEIFGGSGPKRVRELFAEAKACAPCVVFIDEIDAIGSRNAGGRSMGGGGGGGSSEENRTINQLLAELDGLTSNEAIVVIAATNYPEAIDKALLREGRFDRKVNIPMPDKQARIELFEHYLGKVVTGDAACRPRVQTFARRSKPDEAADGSSNSGSGSGADAAKTSTSTTTATTATTSSTSSSDASTTATTPNATAAGAAAVTTHEVTQVPVVPGVSNRAYAEQLADRTPGVTPAQIATIVNEAALIAAAAGVEVVPLPTLQESIDDVLIGKKHRQRMSDKSLRRTAYHEVGHCIMAWRSPLQKDVIKMSIIPRGRAGGYTQQVQDEAMEPHTDEFLFSQLCVLMGGRVAERIFEHDISTGAMDDLQRATRLAMEQLLKYGMSKRIGQLAFRPNDRNDGRAWMTWSEELHAKVEQEARELVAAAYTATEQTLRAHKEQHAQLAEMLLERKELSKDDIAAILGPRPPRPPRPGDDGSEGSSSESDKQGDTSTSATATAATMEASTAAA